MIKVFGSNVGDEELKQVEESMRNQWLGGGPKLKTFEEKFKKKIGTNNYLMIDNASNGLFLSLRLLNLPEGSEVILPSFTWIACANAIKMCNCVPIFCDVDLATQNVTAALIEPLITNKTRAIVVVHYAGLPVDLDHILEFNIPVIEDAAHAVDSFYKNRHCGTIGDFGVFSYDSMKNIAVGEGGGFTCKNHDLCFRAERMRLSGMGTTAYQQAGDNPVRWWEQEVSDIFIKMIPSDIAAGIAIAQLDKLDKLQKIRKRIWEAYKRELVNVGDLQLPVEADISAGNRHSYFTFLIRTKKRDQLAAHLYENGVYTTLRFFPIHLMKLYQTGHSLTNTEKLKETALNIPLHPAITDFEMDKIITEIKKFFN
jgi:dTDP-4-amino-4,6-dideoxygalactose transaminase